MKKIFSFVLAAGLLVANTVNAEKFFFGLESGEQGDQELSITMDDNYNLTIQLPGTGSFDPEEFLMTVRMRGTEQQKLVEGGTSTQLNLRDMLGYAYSMTGCTMNVATDVEGTQVDLVYTVARNGDVITATVDDSEAAASVWADFKDKLIKSTQVTPESFFEMAAGSYIISGNERMDYANAITLLKGNWSVNGTISKLAEGVVSSIAQSSKDMIVIKDGSKLAFGGKVAQLNSDLTITLNHPQGSTAVEGRLSALKSAMTTGTPSEIVKNTVNKVCGIFSETCQMVNNKEITSGATLEGLMQHVRSKLTLNRYYTIAFPYAPKSITGADFFSPADYEEPYLAIDPVAIKDVVAGKPYFFQATDTAMVWKYAADASEVSLVENNGMVGVYSDYNVTSAAEEVYMLENNVLYRAETGSFLAAYRAYIKISKIEPQPSAPGRRYMSVRNIATDIDVVEAPAMKDGKMMINGQLIIIRDGKMFNAQGAEL